MMVTEDSQADALTRTSELSEKWCTMFVNAARCRVPVSGSCVVGDAELRFRFPTGDVLRLDRHDGFTTITCALDDFPGNTHFILMPEGSITNYEAAVRFLAQHRAIDVVEDAALPRELRRHMAVRVEEIRANQVTQAASMPQPGLWARCRASLAGASRF